MRNLWVLGLTLLACGIDNSVQCQAQPGELLSGDHWYTTALGNTSFSPLDQFCAKEGVAKLAPFGSVWLVQTINQVGQTDISATFLTNCKSGTLWIGHGVDKSMQTSSAMGSVSLVHHINLSGPVSYYVVMKAEEVKTCRLSLGL